MFHLYNICSRSFIFLRDGRVFATLDAAETIYAAGGNHESVVVPVNDCAG